MSEFDIRNTQEINYETFERNMLQKAKDLNLNLGNKHMKTTAKSPTNRNQTQENKFYERSLNLKKSPGEILFSKIQEKIKRFKQSEVMKLFKNVDKNHDRKLDFKEFIEIVDTFDNDLTQIEQRQLFEFMDVDDDNKISSAEFFSRLYPTFFEEGDGKKGFIPEKYDYAIKFIQDINRY